MRLRYVALFASYGLLMTSVVAFLVVRSRSADRQLAWDDEVRLQIQSIVERRYVEPIDPELEQQLFDSAMKGYVGRLDPFSKYFTPEERRELDQDTSGSFGGVGVQVRAVETGLFVDAVHREGPAAAAGIEPGDVVEAVAGESLAGLDRDQMIERVKGEAGSAVTLTVRRGELDPLEFTVTRGVVELDTVPSVRFFDGDLPVGYLRISQFSESTGHEVREALLDLVHERGARALVMDLRGNLGGVVSAAVDVAGALLAGDTVVCVTRGRDQLHQYVTQPDPELAPLDLPLVVLVDGSSASASEILAGALQDHARAVLVGDRTFGKFLVQSIIPLTENEGVVRITTSRYETPRGRSAQRDPVEQVRGGLLPDVRVPLESADEEEDLARQFARQTGPDWETIDGREEEISQVDRQLRTALDLLRDGVAPGERVLRRY